MPLFNALKGNKTRSGQLQEVLCPRCREVLDPELNSHFGDGAQIRIVEGEYSCTCGYEVKVIERYPVISRAVDNERHI